MPYGSKPKPGMSPAMKMGKMKKSGMKAKPRVKLHVMGKTKK